MSKRNAVSYVKPDEPSFLKKIKEQVGYKEGPTVDTKREVLQPVADEDIEDAEDEKPTVVVLKPGDLTQEEATCISQQLKREEEQTPADLAKPIVFKAPSKSKTAEGPESKGKKRVSSSKGDAKTKKQKNKQPLSFNVDEEDA